MNPAGILRAICRPRLLAIGLATALATVPATLVAQPTPGLPSNTLPQAERDRLMQEHAQHSDAAERLIRAGKLDDTVREVELSLDLQRRISGDFRDSTLVKLALLHERRRDWESERKAYRDLIALRERRPVRREWLVDDARRELADIERYASMTPGERQRMLRASELNALLRAEYQRKDYAAAREHAIAMIEIQKDLMGGAHHVYAKGLAQLAALYVAMSDRARAETLYREVLEIRKKALGKAHPDYASTLEDLAALYVAQCDRARAEPLYRESLEIRRKTLGRGHPDLSRGLACLGLLYRDMGEYARAEPLLREALEIAKVARKGVHEFEAYDRLRSEHATTMTNLGLLYLDMGDYAGAYPLLGEANRIRANPKSRVSAVRQQFARMTDPLYAASLNDLAILLKTMGNHAGAMVDFEIAQAITKKSKGEAHPDYARILDNQASVCRSMGDIPRAEAFLREALEIRRKVLGEAHPDYGESLANLAGCYGDRKDYAHAEVLLGQARDILRAARGEAEPRYARILDNLALIYRLQGDDARAEALLREALAIRRRALGEAHPDYADNLSNLAYLHEASGEFARAEPLLREALAIRRKALGEAHPNHARGLVDLALLYHAMGDDARAEPLTRQALKIASAFTLATYYELGETRRLRFLNARRSSLDAYLCIASKTGVPAAELYRPVLAWKGLATGDPADDRSYRESPDHRQRVEQLKRVRARLATLAFDNPPEAQRAAWRTQFEELRQTKESLEAAIARTSNRQRPVTKEAGPGEVAAALPDDTALIDIVAYTENVVPEGGQGRRRREAHLLAFVIRRGQPLAVVPLGPARPVDEAVAAWRRALLARRSDGLNAAAFTLGRLVWEPIRSRLGEARTILIAPDGTLAQFPFAALPGREPGSYLIENLTIGYVPFGRSLLESSDDVTGRGLLAVGDVDFQADPGAAVDPGRLTALAHADDRRAGFTPLPGTGPEARLAADLFRAAFERQTADLLRGPAATETEVKRRLDGGRLRFVHLATHGFFESPAHLAALRVGDLSLDAVARPFPDGKGGGSDDAFELTPLLRCGMVLAGGGRPPSNVKTAEDDPGEDGILTAEEVQSLDLRGTELVVLSACETGLGESEAGQGVLGLQRAFHSAGARAVVASLWKVDDAATAVLMERFYGNLWTKKLSKLEALRRAQLDILNDPGLVESRRSQLATRGISSTPTPLPGEGKPGTTQTGVSRTDPSSWAAFLLSGDGR